MNTTITPEAPINLQKLSELKHGDLFYRVGIRPDRPNCRLGVVFMLCDWTVHAGPPAEGSEWVVVLKSPKNSEEYHCGVIREMEGDTPVEKVSDKNFLGLD